MGELQMEDAGDPIILHDVSVTSLSALVLWAQALSFLG